MRPAPSILVLEDVSKRFGGLNVIEGLSFAVSRGSRTALIGPNGAGKTTVFNLVSGVHSVDSGRILFEGKDISSVPSRRRIRHGIARNFQNVRLMLQYTGYTKFDGASTNYDGNGRNARDNDTLFFNVWVAF